MQQNRLEVPNSSDLVANSVVYLIDDDASLLRGLTRRLRAVGFRVEPFQSAGEFLAHPRSAELACVVLDLQMPDSNGLEVQEWLAAEEDPLPVVFLTAHGDVASSVKAMKRGAVDFLTKPVRGDDLIEAVRRALALGERDRETRALKRMWRERYSSLTPSESRVFALIVKGLPNKAIADDTQVSERTVKAHRAEVMRKLYVQSPAELGRAVEWIGEEFTPSS